MAGDISIDTLIASLKSGWPQFLAIFSIVFALCYISLSRFFTEKRYPEGTPNTDYARAIVGGKTVSVMTHKPFVILISAGIAFLVAAGAIQTNFFMIVDNSYGFVLSAGIILAIYTVLLIPIYKFVDAHVGNRIFTNIAVFGLAWASCFMMRIAAANSGTTPVAWFNIITIFGGIPVLIIGLIVAGLLGYFFKKR